MLTIRNLKIIILCSIALLFIIRCIKEKIIVIKSEEYCGYCDEQTRLISEELCGTYREVNDWFYTKAQSNEFENGNWICRIVKN